MNKSFFTGLLIGLALLLVVAFKPTSNTQKWEYLETDLPIVNSRLRAEKLNELGAQGWEFVSIMNLNAVYFKRPIE